MTNISDDVNQCSTLFKAPKRSDRLWHKDIKPRVKAMHSSNHSMKLTQYKVKLKFLMIKGVNYTL